MTDLPPIPTATARILRLLADRPHWVGDLAKRVPVTGDTLSRALRQLLDERWATVTHEKGSERGWLPQRRYAITQAGREQIARLDKTETP